jgi:hypothetical protein
MARQLPEKIKAARKLAKEKEGSQEVNGAFGRCLIFYTKLFCRCRGLRPYRDSCSVVAANYPFIDWYCHFGQFKFFR